MYICVYMGGCQNYSPFLRYFIKGCRLIMGTQKRGPNLGNYPYIYIYIMHIYTCSEKVPFKRQQPAGRLDGGAASASWPLAAGGVKRV